MGAITADAIRRLPKAELHLHLDSGFEVEDAVRLAEENGVPLLKEPPDAMFDWEDLQEFLTFLDWGPCACPATPSRLRRCRTRWPGARAARVSPTRT